MARVPFVDFALDGLTGSLKGQKVYQRRVSSKSVILRRSKIRFRIILESGAFKHEMVLYVSFTVLFGN
jgi:hypothetical protein